MRLVFVAAYLSYFAPPPRGHAVSATLAPDVAMMFTCYVPNRMHLASVAILACTICWLLLPLFDNPIYLPLFDAPALQPAVKSMAHPLDLGALNLSFSKGGRFMPGYFAIHRCWIALPLAPAVAYGAMSLCFGVSSGLMLYVLVYRATASIPWAFVSAMFFVCSPYFVATHLSFVAAEILMLPLLYGALLCCHAGVRAVKISSYGISAAALFCLTFASLCIKETALFLLIPLGGVLLASVVAGRDDGRRRRLGLAIIMTMAFLTWFLYRSAYVDLTLKGYASQKIDSSIGGVIKQGLYWGIELVFACPLVALIPALAPCSGNANTRRRLLREVDSSTWAFVIVAAAAVMMHFVISSYELRYFLLPLSLVIASAAILGYRAFRVFPRLMALATVMLCAHNVASGISCSHLARVALRTERAAMERLAGLPESTVVQVVTRFDDEAQYLAKNIHYTMRDRFARSDLTLTSSAAGNRPVFTLVTNRSYNDEWGQDLRGPLHEEALGKNVSRIEYRLPVWQCRGIQVVGRVCDLWAACRGQAADADARLNAVGLVTHQTHYVLQANGEGATTSQ